MKGFYVEPGSAFSFRTNTDTSIVWSPSTTALFRERTFSRLWSSTSRKAVPVHGHVGSCFCNANCTSIVFGSESLASLSRKKSGSASAFQLNKIRMADDSSAYSILEESNNCTVKSVRRMGSYQPCPMACMHHDLSIPLEITSSERVLIESCHSSR